MIRKFVGVLVFSFYLIACSSEKVNLSPVSDNLSNDSYTFEEVGMKTKIVTYQSEITNLVSSIPRFKNETVNNEVSVLKDGLNTYVRASSDADGKAQKIAFREFVKSYKKIQKLRKYLNVEQDEVLNRYLVRIKTNVNMLESIN